MLNKNNLIQLKKTFKELSEKDLLDVRPGAVQFDGDIIDRELGMLPGSDC